MKLYQRHDASLPPLELVPCAASTAYKIGMGLVISGDSAAKVGAQEVPEYICMSNKTGAAGEFIQAIRVSKDDTYVAALSAAGTDLKVGDKVTIDADGIRVTATTTASNAAVGVAKIVAFGTSEKASGDDVLIKF